MHRMAGRKGIVGIAGAGNAMTGPMDHAPIRPFLVDQTLQQMRQDGGRDDAQRQMIGLASLTLVAIRAQPATGLPPPY